MKANTRTNKETVHHLYEAVLNNRKFELVGDIVSPDYTSLSGETGVEAFLRGIMGVLSALPDAHWALIKVVSEGDTVIVEQQVTGTNTGYFQDIPPTNKLISNRGFAVYVFEKERIVHHHIQTDRLSFLQQLGLLPEEPEVPKENINDHVFFVDRFEIPDKAVALFVERMNHNRRVITVLPGFVKDQVLVQRIPDGNVVLMTIAEWKSEQHLKEAKKVVQEEYARIGFEPAAFTAALGIKMDRQIYHRYEEVSHAVNNNH